MLRETHPRSFVFLSLLFALFVLFLYGPTIDHHRPLVPGPERRAGLPDAAASRCTGSRNVFQPQSIGDIGGSFDRSIKLGLIVMLLTVDRLVPRRPRLPQALRAAQGLCSTSPSPA